MCPILGRLYKGVYPQKLDGDIHHSKKNPCAKFFTWRLHAFCCLGADAGQSVGYVKGQWSIKLISILLHIGIFPDLPTPWWLYLLSSCFLSNRLGHKICLTVDSCSRDLSQRSVHVIIFDQAEVYEEHVGLSRPWQRLLTDRVCLLVA